VSEKNWNKLYSGAFFNPIHHADDIDPSKIMMFHAKDDPSIPWRSVKKFADRTGVKLKLFARGGHGRTELLVQKHWPEIQRFFQGR